MTDKNKNTESIGNAYLSPQVKVVLMRSQHVLCGSLDGSPSSNDWNGGSESHYGFGDYD